MLPLPWFCQFLGESGKELSSKSASELQNDKKSDLFTEELAKNSLLASDDVKSKEGERKSETTEKPDVEVEDADDDDDDDDTSGSGKIEFGSADLEDKDKDEAVREIFEEVSK